MKKNEKLTPKNFLKRTYKKKVNEHEELPDENHLKYLSIENLYEKRENRKGYCDLKFLLNSTSSCEISDAILSLTNNNGVLKGLKNINGLKAYGKIVTVETAANDWGTSVLAIDKAKKGEVLFIKACHENCSYNHKTIKRSSSAIWGELTSTAAKNKKISGTFVWGYVRDVDHLIHLNYPVFALGTCPNAGSSFGNGTINKSINLGHTHINQGDFIFGDKSGVVLIPKGLFSIAMKRVVDIRINEKNIHNSLKKGETFSKIIYD
ncbi:MAG: RraA family protein [Methanobrevibacter sp.]|jgi:regulator of RNase E activity RraA|nr:RraA family protein [Candidatus Methanovirga basalitermitum]